VSEEATAKPRSSNDVPRVRFPDALLGWIIPVSVLVAWEILARAGMLPPNWLPAPTVIGQTIYQLAVAGDLWRHVGITLDRVERGVSAGSISGNAPRRANGLFRAGPQTAGSYIANVAQRSFDCVGPSLFIVDGYSRNLEDYTDRARRLLSGLFESLCSYAPRRSQAA